MKDYYDIYYLANKFDFDGATLTKSLKKTFENRGHAFTIEQFEQVMAFAENDAMQKKWKAFCRKIDTKTDTFSKVIETINLFLAEPIKAAESTALRSARQRHLELIKTPHSYKTVSSAPYSSRLRNHR